MKMLNESYKKRGGEEERGECDVSRDGESTNLQVSSYFSCI